MVEKISNHSPFLETPTILKSQMFENNLFF